MSSPIGVVNVDVDLLTSMAVDGQVSIKLWRAGKAILAKAEAPTKTKDGNGFTDWMSVPPDGKEPLMGQKYVTNAVYEGKNIQIVRSTIVGCAHMFETSQTAI